MNDSDKERFKSLMVGAGEIYGKEITKPILQIYFQALIGYSIEAVSDSFSKHLVDSDHGTFFPKPADLVRHLEANKPSCEARAKIAWMQVQNAISSIGSYGTLHLKDKQALAAVKSLGSWKDLCMTDVDKMQWKEKQFLEAYETFENTPLEMLPHNLPGITEMHNQRLESKGQMKSLMDGLNEFKLKNNL